MDSLFKGRMVFPEYGEDRIAGLQKFLILERKESMDNRLFFILSKSSVSM